MLDDVGGEVGARDLHAPWHVAIELRAVPAGAVGVRQPRRLLVPLSCILGGIGMIVDRESGAQRDLLAAPAPRSLMVLGNLTVALAVSMFQVIALIGASVARGATFGTAVSGWLWAASGVVGLATLMHGVAEISAMPAALAAIAKVFPVTHVLALTCYGLVDHNGHALHDIWGMTNTTAMASLSLAVIVVFAGAVLALSTRVFTHSAVG